jgi:hypothetical protein
MIKKKCKRKREALFVASQGLSYLKFTTTAKPLFDILKRLRPRKISALSVYSAGL